MRAFFLPLLCAVTLLVSCEKPSSGFVITPPDPHTNTNNNNNNNNNNTNPSNTEPGTTETTVPTVEAPAGPIIVGYATYWDKTIPNPELLTHICYAFAHIKADFETLDIKTPSRLSTIAGLKKQKTTLKVLLSIGGWEAGNFSEMAASETHRKKFVENCVTAVTQYGLDGIDLDWEYPTSNAAGISSSPDDTKNFTLLVKDLRTALGKDKLLSMASSSSAKYIDFKEVTPYFNFINLMTYDMGDPPQHNAGLYPSSRTYRSCDESVSLHYKAGVPYNKMVLGIPFYGHGDGKNMDDYIDYRDIKPGNFTEVWDNTAKVPFLVDAAGNMVFTFDNARSVGLKADYVKDKALAGAMYWNIEADDDKWTLSRAISTRLIGTGAEDPTPADAFLATNQYVQKYLEEVNYPNTNNPDADVEYSYTSVIGYPGGGPSTNNEEIPPTYTISWTASASAQTLTVKEGSWTRTYSLNAGVGSQTITNLVPNATYEWTVTASGKKVASGSFATTGLLHQVFFEPNVRNGRDLGGWKGLNGKTVAYRKLFRGGVLKEKKEGEYLNEAGKQEMRAQGILAELDLQEEGSAQTSSPIGSDIAFYAPHFDSGWNTMVRDNPAKVRDCFIWVVARLRENKPVYFHCWSGRDRTGTMAVLLLGTLGVSESDMAKDFEVTYFSPKSWSMYQGSYQHTRNNYSYKSIRKTIYKETDSGTYQERIVKYLLKIGVPQKDIDDLRSIMLVNP